MSTICDIGDIGEVLLILMDSLSVAEYFEDFSDEDLHSLVFSEAQCIGMGNVNAYLEADEPVDRLPRELLLAVLCRVGVRDAG